MTYTCPALAAVALFGAAAWAQTLPQKSAATNRAVGVAQILIADDSPETRATVARLSTPVEKFAAKQATLRQALDGIRQAMGTNLAVMWPDLEAAGVKQETPISFLLENVSADQLLRTTMALAAPGQLDYLVSDGVVEVRTRAWMERRKFARTYTAKVLMEKGFYPDTQPEDRAAQVVELCRQMATPEQWSRSGMVCKLGGTDVIAAAPMRTHYELSDLFSDLYHPVRVSPERAAKVEVPAWLAATAGWAAAQKSLAEPVNLSLADQPLSAAMERVRAAGPPNLVMDWNTLAKIGAAPETHVSYQSPNPPAPLEQALREIAGSHAPPGANSVAVACSSEGVLMVTLSSAVEPEPRIAVYDLRDVIRRRIFENPRQKPTQRAVMTDILNTLANAGFPFKAAAALAAGDVAPKNGAPGVFIEFEGMLVVRAAPQVQRDLAGALSRLDR